VKAISLKGFFFRQFFFLSNLGNFPQNYMPHLLVLPSPYVIALLHFSSYSSFVSLEPKWISPSLHGPPPALFFPIVVRIMSMPVASPFFKVTHPPFTPVLLGRLIFSHVFFPQSRSLFDPQFFSFNDCPSPSLPCTPCRCPFRLASLTQ